MLRMIPRFLILTLFYAFSSVMGAGDHPWRFRADAYVSSALQSSPQRIKAIAAALHDAKNSADITQCLQQLGEVQKDAGAYHQAIGVKATTIFCECARERLLHMIRCIDAQIEFCEDRKTNPITMLFYRAPSSWSSHKTNYDLQADINTLYERKEKYLQQLGSLAMAADSFPAAGSPDETATWTKSVINAVASDAAIHTYSTQDLMRVLRLVDDEYGAVQKLTHESRVSRFIEQGFNGAVRAGIFGITAALTGIGYFWGQSTTENANKAQKDAFAKLKLERDKIKQNMKNGVDALKNKLNEKKSETPVSDNANAQAQDATSSASSINVPAAPVVVQPPVPEVANPVNAGLQSSKSPLDAIKAAAHKIKNLGSNASSPSVSAPASDTGNPTKNGSSSSAGASANDTSMSARVATGLGTGLARGVLNDQEIREGAIKAIDHVNGLAVEARSMLAAAAAIPVDALFETAGNVADSLDKAIDNKILSKVGRAYSAASIILGVAASLYYLKRIASKNGKVYTAMKKAILDISHMIAAYDQSNQAMTPQDLGTIIYIGSRLHEYASAVLSAEEVELLASDIAQLQSSRISILNKTKIVQRMYSTYSFLVPSRALII